MQNIQARLFFNKMDFISERFEMQKRANIRQSLAKSSDIISIKISHYNL